MATTEPIRWNARARRLAAIAREALALLACFVSVAALGFVGLCVSGWF